MHGQLHCRHANAMALSSSPVVSALGSKSDNPRSSHGQGKALYPWGVREKKMQAPLLGLAKSIYYTLLLQYLSLPRSIGGYQQIVREAWRTLQWTGIPSRGGVTVITPSDYVLRKLG